MRLARHFGISTVPFALIRLADDTLAYISKRIDREEVADRKIGMEDFCQLSRLMTEDKYRSSYERCATIIRTYSVQSGLDIIEFYMRIIFSFLSGNSDMHLKNFSLIELERGWTLSPAYDLVNTTLLLPDDTEETALTLHGKNRRLTHEDFLAFGKHIGVPDVVIRRLNTRISDLWPLMRTTIESSHLPGLSKVRFISIVEDRMARLLGNH